MIQFYIAIYKNNNKKIANIYIIFANQNNKMQLTHLRPILKSEKGKTNEK